MGRKKYVYLEFSINTIILGKVYFELFNDEEIKKSTENFLNLCKGNKYHSIYSDEILSYKNCKVEKIKKNKCIKSGYLRNKITYENRVNSNLSKENKYEKLECIYGKSYKKEYSKRRHLNAGLLTMVEIEDKKYSSIFKITLNKVNKYNNKNIIIGRVIKNMHILRAIEIIPVTKNFMPKINVYISDCNEVSESFFKSDKISSRQLYIDNLFANLNEKKTNDDDDELEVEAEDDDKYFDSNNDDYVFGKFQSKKKKKKEITEKQKGIELLNKILSDIDNISKNKVPFRKSGEISFDNLKECINNTNEEKVSSDKISKQDIVENESEKENNKITNKDNSLIYSYEYNNLNKQMSEREKKLLNIQLKINQSKALNQMEVQREKLYGNSNNQMKKFREYLQYKQEKNLTIKNTIPQGKNKNESNKDINKNKGEENEENREEEEEEKKKEIELKEKEQNEDNEKNSKNEKIAESSDEENKKNYKLYNTSAVKVKSIMKKKKKKNAFDLDNDIDLYKKIKFNFSINRKIYDEKKKLFGDNFYGNNLLINDNSVCTENDKNKILEFCKKQEELRSKFSRKRNEENELFKNYINKRNKIYNKKLDRYFNKHTIEIRQNLERTI
ncbi:peptidyl-prolyl cis-trans isomerase, putative [Plasmodium relictum]|uniref:Peptidyl-prolyl cis-trans isomerase, putative n=1 Tax=Plasmodium relictum TaxID=85471 RepID=A0A1J1H0X5_PLARL|nr:peptidyl-prolyl cis-trans isomerase, putative [Plasmodium relictum]CRG98498.1 peptidyl-prolyl cis-trans isomerase, putative [Plasmodium relictum]